MKSLRIGTLLILVVVVLVMLMPACAKPAPSPSPAPPPAAAPKPIPAPTPSPSPPAPTPKEVTLRWAAGPSGSWATLAMTAFAQAITKYAPGPKIKFDIILGESDTNVTTVNDGLADLAMTGPGFLHPAWKGEAPYNKPQRNIRQIWTHSANYAVVATLVKSRVQNISELKNKKFNTGPKGFSSNIIGTIVLAEYGITGESVKQAGGVWSNVSTKDGAAMLRDGTLDADFIAYSAYAINSAHIEVETLLGLRLLPWDEDKIEKVVNKYPWVIKGKVGAGVIQSLKEPYVAPGMTIGVIVHKDMPDDLVYRIMEGMYHPNAFAEIQEATKGQSADAVPKQGWVAHVVPTHPGAEKWFKDHNIKAENTPHFFPEMVQPFKK